ncbi:hypothetical protein JL720_13292 [Aureococcus anophagefferens]|nr:hypothetical protein JL720_13292 [Aureococcus anophagefferens]
MASFAAGDWLWLDSTEDSWIPVRAVAAFKAGEAGQAEAEDGSAFNDLSEGPLLHNLRKRYGKDGIYTWVGSILVAVNPFQVLPNCYTPENLARYVRSQAICISGESGAGKTESMKLMLQFLAEASGRASGAAGKRPSVVGAGELSVEQQILQTNPADGERGYHAFYQLLAHCHDDAALCADLRLGAAVCDDWRYVNMSSAHEVPGIDDKRDYDDVATALRALNFSDDEGLSVWKLVAGLLHVGNVAFAAGPKDEATVADAAPLETGSAVLGLDAAALREGLISKNIGTRSIIRTELSAAQADDARDAFAKAAFSRLFDFLILKINAALSGIGGGASGGLAVGVLDIFGFEFFEVNSFEQLCINYCNEKLQFHFNDHIFSQEAAEYTREGVDLAMVEFKNNGPTLELLEHKRSGVFAMLDEECVVPRGSDGGYLSKLFKAHEKHANFERCKPKEAQARTSFAVIHYAARVKYGTTGFLEKNRDRLLDGLVLCGGASTDAVVASLFAADAKELGSGKKSKKVKTLGANFRGQLRDLVDALNACEPHFVRCIKPNSVKRPRVFTAPMVQSQMRCAGVLEVCKIRRAGFPFRSKFADFERRYHYIDVAAKGCPSLVAGLEKQRILVSGEWALGKTKVFLRAAARDKLEAARERALEKIMLHAQACGRRYLARCRLCTWLRLTRKLAAAVASCDVEACEDALRDWYLLPHGGKHLAVCARGLAFKEESKALQAIIGECRSAMDRRDVAALDASVAKLKAAGNASLASVLEAAEALCHRLKHEPEVRAALVAAARAEDAAALEAALDDARAMGMAGPEVDAAARRGQVEERADVKQLEIVNRAPGALDRARDSRDLAELRALLRDAAAAGVPAADLRDCADFVAAVEREVEALAALDAATKQASSFSKPLETRRDGLAAALDGAAACERGGAGARGGAAVAGDGDLGDRIAALAAALEGAEDVYHGDPPPRVSAAAKTLAKWEGERATLERLAAEERDAEAKRQRLADLDAKLAAATSSDAAHDAAYAESLKQLLSAAADEGLASANATAAKSKLDYVLQKLAAAARCADALGAVEHGDAALAADELRAAERACLAAGFDGPELGDVRAALAACEDRGRGRDLRARRRRRRRPDGGVQERPRRGRRLRPLRRGARRQGRGLREEAAVAEARRAPGPRRRRRSPPSSTPSARWSATSRGRWRAWTARATRTRSRPRRRSSGGVARAAREKNDAPSLDRCEDLAHVVRRELAARRDLAEAADRRDADLLTAALAAAKSLGPRVVARRNAAKAVAADVRAADEAERVAAEEARAKADAERRREAARRSATPRPDDVDALDAALADAAAALVDGAALDRGRAARGPRRRSTSGASSAATCGGPRRRRSARATRRRSTRSPRPRVAGGAASLDAEVPELAAAEDLAAVLRRELDARGALRAAADARDRDALTGALAAAAKLGPGVGDSPELAAEARVDGMLRKAVVTEDLAEVSAAVTECYEALGGDIAGRVLESLDEAKKVLDRLQTRAERERQAAEERAAEEAALAKRRDAEAALDAAAKGDSVEAIDAALEAAAVAGVDGAARPAAAAQAARAALVAGAAKDAWPRPSPTAAAAAALEAVLAACRAAGLGDGGDVAKLSARLDDLKARRDATDAMDAARESRNPLTLQYAIGKAKAAGVGGSAVREAEALLVALKRSEEAEAKKEERRKDCLAALNGAVVKRDAAALDALLVEAAELGLDDGPAAAARDLAALLEARRSAQRAIARCCRAPDAEALAGARAVSAAARDSEAEIAARFAESGRRDGAAACSRLAAERGAGALRGAVARRDGAAVSAALGDAYATLGGDVSPIEDAVEAAKAASASSRPRTIGPRARGGGRGRGRVPAAAPGLRDALAAASARASAALGGPGDDAGDAAKALAAALSDAAVARLEDAPAYADAAAVLEKLGGLVRAREALALALAALDGDGDGLDALRAAVDDCAARGAAAGELAKARTALRKGDAKRAATLALRAAEFEAQRSATARLEACVVGGDAGHPAAGVQVKDLDALLLEAGALFSDDTPAMANARRARETLNLRRKCLQKVRRAAAVAARTRDSGELDAACAAAEALGLAPDDEEDLEAAEDLMLELHCEAEARAKLVAALGAPPDARNLALRSAIAAAKREKGLADGVELASATRELARREAVAAARAGLRSATGARGVDRLARRSATPRRDVAEASAAGKAEVEAARALLEAVEQEALLAKARAKEDDKAAASRERRGALGASLTRATADGDGDLLDRLLDECLGDAEYYAELPAFKAASAARHAIRVADRAARRAALEKRASSSVLRAAVEAADAAALEPPSRPREPSTSTATPSAARARDVAADLAVGAADRNAAASLRTAKAVLAERAANGSADDRGADAALADLRQKTEALDAALRGADQDGAKPKSLEAAKKTLRRCERRLAGGGAGVTFAAGAPAESGEDAAFHWTRYGALKSEDAFLEGLYSPGEKRRAADRRLRYQSTPLHASVCALDDADRRDAARACHRDVLTFCGELYHQFPNEMARDLLAKGRDDVAGGKAGAGDLADEILVQLLKHLTANDGGATSATRGWRLLYLCVRTFPPGAELLPYVRALARSRADARAAPDDGDGDDDDDAPDAGGKRLLAVGDAAKLAAKVLDELDLQAAEGTLAEGRPFGSLPTLEEIATAASNEVAVAKRRKTALVVKKQRLATLVGGTTQLLELRPDLAPALESARAEVDAAFASEDRDAIARAHDHLEHARRLQLAAAAVDLDGGNRSAVVDDARALVDRLHEQIELRNDLDAATLGDSAAVCAGALKAAKAAGQDQLAAYDRCAERHKALDTSYSSYVASASSFFGF